MNFNLWWQLARYTEEGFFVVLDFSEVGVACRAVECCALWELLSCIQICPKVIILKSFLGQETPTSKFILHFDNSI